MKNIDYFLSEEANYTEKFSNAQYLSLPKLDRLLTEKCISEYISNLANSEIKTIQKSYSLVDVEVLILLCFLGGYSCVFRDDYYRGSNNIPDVVKEMQKVLTSLLKKAPKHSDGVVYRFLRSHDRTDLKVGEVFVPSYSLTCTCDNWEKDTDVYVIKPLNGEKTLAYDLYKIYNHGNEKQVNFLKGTRFKVTKIERRKGRKWIYMDELCCE